MKGTLICFLSTLYFGMQVRVIIKSHHLILKSCYTVELLIAINIMYHMSGKTGSYLLVQHCHMIKKKQCNVDTRSLECKQVELGQQVFACYRAGDTPILIREIVLSYCNVCQRDSRNVLAVESVNVFQDRCIPQKSFIIMTTRGSQ